VLVRQQPAPHSRTARRTRRWLGRSPSRRSHRSHHSRIRSHDDSSTRSSRIAWPAARNHGAGSRRHNRLNSRQSRRRSNRRRNSPSSTLSNNRCTRPCSTRRMTTGRNRWGTRLHNSRRQSSHKSAGRRPRRSICCDSLVRSRPSTIQRFPAFHSSQVRNRGESVDPQPPPMTTLRCVNLGQYKGDDSGAAKVTNRNGRRVHPIARINKLCSKPLDSNYNDTLDST